jgi:hypothetical protein
MIAADDGDAPPPTLHHWPQDLTSGGNQPGEIPIAPAARAVDQGLSIGMALDGRSKDVADEACVCRGAGCHWFRPRQSSVNVVSRRP